MAVLIEFVIFGGLAYWLFSDRARAVIDFISTKLQELYNKWEALGKLPQKKDKRFRKDKYVNDVQVRLNNKKESRSNSSAEFNCTLCGPSKRGSLINAVNDGDNTSSIDILQVKNLKSYRKGLMSKLMPHLNQALSFKKYSFAYIYESVLKDEKIQEICETAAQKMLEESETITNPSMFAEFLKKQNQRAEKILINLRSTFSNEILRISSFVMTRVMIKLFSEVVVNPVQINMLHKAKACNLPLIFLPLHRSHLDYIIITYILANNNIKSPLVAAGENLRIPFFGSLLRGLGAFFIKRRMDPVNGKRDILYRAILHTYMINSLKSGHNFEFFIEGGRTRSGKPCMPKGGLLSVFLDAYMDGTIEDALLVPVSINYERLVDGNFIREQMGQPKQQETFSSAISAIWKCLTSYYGTMRVDFNQPFSLSELVNKFQNKTTSNTQGNKKVLHTVPSTTSLYGTDVVVEEHRQLVNNIARHVIFDCSCSTAIMSTNAVSFLLCNAYREGVELEEFAETLDKLRDELHSCNKSVGFTGKSTDVIIHAIKILGSELVQCERNCESGKEILRPITKLPNIIELSYYSNTLIPHFVLEAAVVRSLYCLQQSSGEKKVSQTELLETSQRLCEILQYEFIFSKFCQSLDASILSTIETLLSKKIILCQNETDTNKNTEHELQYMENCNHYHLAIYNAILQPLLDVYIITFHHLQSLQTRNISDTEFVEEILEIIKSQLDIGKLKYGESMSVDTVRNSLKLLEKWDVLDCYSEKKVKTYSLGERYNDDISLEEVISRIEQFNTILNLEMKENLKS